jgi:uncharacterized membrane protein YuzA (DUF378 family)
MRLDLFRIALILLVVGGLNWGAIGLLGKDLVVALLGKGNAAKAVYVLVGLAAVFVGLKMFGFIEGFETMENNAMTMEEEEQLESNGNEGFENMEKEKEGFENMEEDEEEGFYSANAMYKLN